MELNNQTIATEFILLGFSVDLKINILLFILVAVIYSVICIGNSLVICIISIIPHLHTPMYFFLGNLSFLDLCYSSNAVPKFLIDILSTKRTISLSACTFQVYASLFLGGVECLILAVMAYDRYTAICCPLYYTILMSWRVCCKSTVIVWIGSFVIIFIPSFIFRLVLCNPNQINHFMCEALAVIKLACGDFIFNELLIFSFSFILILAPFLFILVSYICIICSILKLNRVSRGKAFSTCTSHLTVVSLLYGISMIMYSGSSSHFLSQHQKYFSVFYVIISPMLNPLIYSLRNREVKEAFKKTFSKINLGNSS